MSNPGDKNEVFDLSSIASFLTGYASRLREALLAVGLSASEPTYSARALRKYYNLHTEPQ